MPDCVETVSGNVDYETIDFFCRQIFFKILEMLLES